MQLGSMPAPRILRGGELRFGPVVNAGALALLAGEPEGMAIDATIDNRGMVAVRDKTTPGNNVTNIPIHEWLNNGATSPKRVRKADGAYVWSPHNYVHPSEAIDDWAATRMLFGDAISAPNGVVLKKAIPTNDDSGSHYIRRSGRPTGVDIVCRFVAAASGMDFVCLSGNSAGIRAIFDLSSGEVVTSVGVTNAGIEPLGGGFFLCSATVNAGSGFVDIFPIPMSAFTPFTTFFAGDEVSGVYIGGVHVAYGGDYLKTTSTSPVFTPALHVDPTHGRGMLAEPQKTNLLAYSSDFSNWDQSSVALSQDGTVGPLGVNATLISGTGVGSRVTLTATIGTETSICFWALVKAGSGDGVRLLVYNVTETDAVKTLNVADLEASAYVDVGGGFRLVHYSIASTDGVGWTNGDTLRAYIYTAAGGGGDGSTLYAAHAQLEAGSVPTSPIPTAGAQVTRSRDAFNQVINFPLGDQSEISVFARFVTLAEADSSLLLWELNDNSTDNRVAGRFNELTGAYNHLHFTSGDNSSINIGAAGGEVAVASRYKENDEAVSRDGSAVMTDMTVGASTGLTRFLIGFGSAQAAPETSFLLKSFVLVPRAWNDAELQQWSAAA